MKAVKSSRSMKSTATMVSMKSTRSMFSDTTNVHEKQNPFNDIISQTMTKLQCPVKVVVLPWPAKPNSRKSTNWKGLESSSASVNLSESTKSEESTDNTIPIYAVHNTQDRLVEITVKNYKVQLLPREFMQILGVVLPNYAKLSQITVKNCFIDMYTIYELSKIVLGMTITDVCLDASFVPEANYDILLQEGTSVHNLSLKNCMINDTVCKNIASRMHFLQPAETVLQTLNLSSNHISDEGAAFLAEALRNNRHLRYLNLSDNHITDEGARCLFNVLKEFPLTGDEIYAKRKYKMQYMRHKYEIYKRLLRDYNESTPANVSLNKTSKNNKKTLVSTKVTQAPDEINKFELMATDLIGPCEHPFSDYVLKDDYPHSKGNMVLCYLNLAYNNLTYPSIEKLLEVLEIQKIYKNNKQCGLIKVVLDGNNLPNCPELVQIDNIFREGLRNFYPRRKSTMITRL